MAYGYQKLDLSVANQDPHVKFVIDQINKKYSKILVKSTLTSVEQLTLITKKVNYKIVYTNSEGIIFKFLIYYDSIMKKILILNSVNLEASSSYTRLST